MWCVSAHANTFWTNFLIKRKLAHNAAKQIRAHQRRPLKRVPSIFGYALSRCVTNRDVRWVVSFGSQLKCHFYVGLVNTGKQATGLGWLQIGHKLDVFYYFRLVWVLNFEHALLNIVVSDWSVVFKSQNVFFSRLKLVTNPIYLFTQVAG